MRSIIGPSQGRRQFLKALGVGVLALGSSPAAAQTRAKPMRGLFPIGASPFTDADQLDLECLAAQVKFLNRGRVHGVIWPQIASEWTTLSKKERLDGAEAMTAAGKGGTTAIVIGVQGPDLPTVLEYVKHAEKAGADAICSLPPPNVTDDNELFAYYRQLGGATGLPLFVQSQPFPMSVDLIVRMYKEIPTFRQIKDEAGDTLARITEIRTRTNDGVKVFTGNGVRMMINELMLGAQGYCPTTDLADIYAQTFDLWYAGKHTEAFDMFGRVLCFNSIVQTAGAPQKYVLVARGVFKNTRRRGGSGGATGGRAGQGGGGRAARAFTAESEKVVREALNLLKPYMRA
jgi:dihydrodipicolinate synthase/N-acetylneuraminate lyase